MPRPSPARAVLPLVVTVRGWDTTTVTSDLAAHLAASLPWAEVGRTVIPADAAPLELGEVDGLASRVGALTLTIDFNQPAPEYTPEGDQPDMSEVRILCEQIVSSRSEDRAMLLERRRDIMRELAIVNGIIGTA